jgi:hypothetical protein
MLMTLLGRETPDLPAEVLFSDIELQVLRAYAKKNVSNRHQPFRKPCDSSDALVDTWVANTTHHLATN